MECPSILAQAAVYQAQLIAPSKWYFRDHGSRAVSLKQVLAPAIKLAEKGVLISSYEAKHLNAYRNFFEKNDEAARILSEKSGVVESKRSINSERSIQNTKTRYQNMGVMVSIKEIAELIIEMQNGNGLISLDDLKKYKSIYREPLIGFYKGHQIVSMGPPSSGGALLVNMLNMLENYSTDSLQWNSSRLCPYNYWGNRKSIC